MTRTFGQVSIDAIDPIDGSSVKLTGNQTQLENASQIAKMLVSAVNAAKTYDINTAKQLTSNARWRLSQVGVPSSPLFNTVGNWISKTESFTQQYLDTMSVPGSSFASKPLIYQPHIMIIGGIAIIFVIISIIFLIR